MEKQKFDSRYKDVNTVMWPVNDKQCCVITNAEFLRMGFSEDTDAYKKEIKWIDFEGGPLIHVGDEIQGRKLKKIKSVYLFEFE